jgi:hypothetical protein
MLDRSSVSSGRFSEGRLLIAQRGGGDRQTRAWRASVFPIRPRCCWHDRVSDRITKDAFPSRTFSSFAPCGGALTRPHRLVLC